jgi:hypothetical protein
MRKRLSLKLFKIPHPKALVMLWRQLGLPVLAGICCMLAMLATQIKISRPPPRMAKGGYAYSFYDTFTLW